MTLVHGEPIVREETPRHRAAAHREPRAAVTVFGRVQHHCVVRDDTARYESASRHVESRSECAHRPAAVVDDARIVQTPRTADISAGVGVFAAVADNAVRHRARENAQARAAGRLEPVGDVRVPEREAFEPCPGIIHRHQVVAARAALEDRLLRSLQRHDRHGTRQVHGIERIGAVRDDDPRAADRHGVWQVVRRVRPALIRKLVRTVWRHVAHLRNHRHVTLARQLGRCVRRTRRRDHRQRDRESTRTRVFVARLGESDAALRVRPVAEIPDEGAARRIVLRYGRHKRAGKRQTARGCLRREADDERLVRRRLVFIRADVRTFSENAVFATEIDRTMHPAERRRLVDVGLGERREAPVVCSRVQEGRLGARVAFASHSRRWHAAVRDGSARRHVAALIIEEDRVDRRTASLVEAAARNCRRVPHHRAVLDAATRLVDAAARGAARVVDAVARHQAVPERAARDVDATARLRGDVVRNDAVGHQAVRQVDAATEVFLRRTSHVVAVDETVRDDRVRTMHVDRAADHRTADACTSARRDRAAGHRAVRHLACRGRRCSAALLIACDERIQNLTAEESKRRTVIRLVQMEPAVGDRARIDDRTGTR